MCKYCVPGLKFFPKMNPGKNLHKINLISYLSNPCIRGSGYGYLDSQTLAIKLDS